MGRPDSGAHQFLSLLIEAAGALVGGMIGYEWADRPISGRASITIRAGCIGVILTLSLKYCLKLLDKDRGQPSEVLENPRDVFRSILIFASSGAILGTVIGFFMSGRKPLPPSLSEDVDLSKFHLQRDRVRPERDHIP